MNPVEMPYRIELFPGIPNVIEGEPVPPCPEGDDAKTWAALWKESNPSRTETPMNPYKVYGNGLSCPATPEEVAVWEYVQELENKLLAESIKAEVEAMPENDDVAGWASRTPMPMPILELPKFVTPGNGPPAQL